MERERRKPIVDPLGRSPREVADAVRQEIREGQARARKAAKEYWERHPLSRSRFKSLTRIALPETEFAHKSSSRIDVYKRNPKNDT